MRHKLIVFMFALVSVSFLCFPLAFADDGSGSGSAMVMTDAGAGSGSSATPTATTAPSLPDPIAHPVEAATTARELIKQWGYVWGGMLVLFTIGTVLVKRAETEHWLSKDHTLPIVVSMLGILGAAINWKFAGGTLYAIFAAVMGSAMLIIQKPASKPPTTAAAA
jgi:hypothetical protein